MYTQVGPIRAGPPVTKERRQEGVSTKTKQETCKSFGETLKY